MRRWFVAIEKCKRFPVLSHGLLRFNQTASLRSLAGWVLRIAVLVSLMCVGLSAQAQAFLDFSSTPTLVTGTALTQGAQYRYANALPGIDVLVTLAQFNGALSPMVNLDDNTIFPTRFQPVIKRSPLGWL